MKPRATIIRNLPDVPREPTKAKRIDIYVDVVSKYIMPLDAKYEQDKKQREEAKKKEEEKTEARAKRGKDKQQRQKLRPWTQEDINQMLKMHRDGCTQEQIAEALGRSRGNVSTRLKKAKEGRLW